MNYEQKKKILLKRTPGQLNHKRENKRKSYLNNYKLVKTVIILDTPYHEKSTVCAVRQNPQKRLDKENPSMGKNKKNKCSKTSKDSYK